MNNIQTAIFGGGCFWCTEAIFQRLRGVMSVTSGYSGGHVPNPTYEQVSAGDTGHAEAIKINFDPNQISYRDLVNVFMATHDPTAKDRQGNDAGPQYRSTIFYMNQDQKKQAEDYIKKLNREQIFGKPIVTEINSFDKFYEAESYHKNYYNQNSDKPYCQFVINPKIAKLKAKFAPLLKPE
jgi:peptide-methionine (S)-S-oxide reductase